MITSQSQIATHYWPCLDIWATVKQGPPRPLQLSPDFQCWWLSSFWLDCPWKVLWQCLRHSGYPHSIVYKDPSWATAPSIAVLPLGVNTHHRQLSMLLYRPLFDSVDSLKNEGYSSITKLSTVALFSLFSHRVWSWWVYWPKNNWTATTWVLFVVDHLS